MGLDIDKVKMFAVDVDGTLTNGLYTVDESGIVSKSFHTRDFYALNRMKQLGFTIVIITSAQDTVIEEKCRPFEFLVYTGVENKAEEMSRILKAHKMKWENLAYIGDAENDLECMSHAAFTGCPLDAIPEVVEGSNYQSVQNGGHAAVYDIMRKYCDYAALDW